MKILFSFLIFFFSMLMLFLNHPLSMGLMILSQTILTCLLSGMLINTYWFSYILFLTFLGGLLVLFIYVSSVASNELFPHFNNYSYLIIIFFLSLLLLLFMNITFNSNLNWLNFSTNEEMNKLFYKFIYFNNEEKMDLSKLYNNQTFMLMIMMIIFLFITLLAVVKITNIFYGPIRSNKY